MDQQRLWIVIFLLILSAGCRKDGDDNPPSVQILLPTAGSTWSVPDTLLVRVQVSDDHVVESVVIDLVDGNGISVAPSVIAYPGSDNAVVERELLVTDERILSGTYTLVARATDGTNDGRGFLDIQLTAAPLRLRAIFLAPPFSTTITTIQRVDSVGSLSDWTTVQDFNGIAVDSYSQHVMLAGSQYAPMQALPTSGLARLWQVDAPANDQPQQFTALRVDPGDGRTYLSTRDGFIRGYTGSGVQQFTAQCVTGYRCEDMVAMDDVLATWQRAIVGGASKIVTYTIAGTILEERPVEHERIALFHRTGTSLVHFANESGSGLIEDLNTTSGSTPEVRNFSGELIRSVVRTDANTYVIALGSRLVRFHYPTNTVNEISSGLSAAALAYDAASGALYAAVGTTLFTMDPSSGAVTNTLPTGATIAFILPLLNR